MKTATKIILSTFLATLVVAIASSQIPLPAAWTEQAWAFYWSLILNTAAACLHVGATVLFLMSLGVFKEKLRRAYRLIAVAIVFIAIGSLQLPILNAFGLWETWWSVSGIIALPLVCGGLFAYIGTKNLSELVGVRTLLTKFWVVIPTIIVISACTMLLPHAFTVTPETTYDATNAILAWGMLLDLAAVLVTIGVMRHIGAHYKNAMAWLIVPLAFSASVYAIVTLQLLLTGDYAGTLSRIVDVLIAVSGLLWLRAGQAFMQTREV